MIVKYSGVIRPATPLMELRNIYQDGEIFTLGKKHAFMLNTRGKYSLDGCWGVFYGRFFVVPAIAVFDVEDIEATAENCDYFAWFTHEPYNSSRYHNDRYTAEDWLNSWVLVNKVKRLYLHKGGDIVR